MPPRNTKPTSAAPLDLVAAPETDPEVKALTLRERLRSHLKAQRAEEKARRRGGPHLTVREANELRQVLLKAAIKARDALMDAVDETLIIPAELKHEAIRALNDAVELNDRRYRRLLETPLASNAGDDEVLTFSQVCAMIGVSEPTMRERIKTGAPHPPFFRNGRRYAFRRGAVREWMDRQATRQKKQMPLMPVVNALKRKKKTKANKSQFGKKNQIRWR